MMGNKKKRKKLIQSKYFYLKIYNNCKFDNYSFSQNNLLINLSNKDVKMECENFKHEILDKNNN